MLFDFAALSTENRYKLLVSTVVPRPIAWVVSENATGRRNAAPFSFFNAFSADPAIVCIGIGGSGGGEHPRSVKDTAANIRESGQFVVNLVPERLATQMNVTAIAFPPETDELAEAGLETHPSTKVRPPRIAGSPVAMECERHSMIDLNGDRAIVLGRVVAMHVADEAVLNAARCHIDTVKLDLIGRLSGAGWYVRASGDRFEMPRIAFEDWLRRGGATP